MPKARKPLSKSPRTMGFDVVPGAYVDPRHEWDREPLAPLNIPAATFEIWIAATDIDGHKKSGGPSACAWKIRVKSEAGVSKDTDDKWPGRNVQSSEKKAYVAAVAGSLDRLPAGSKAIVCCREQYIVSAINGLLDNWKEKGELAEGKRQRPYAKVWLHVLAARDRITSNPKDIRARPPNARDDEIIEQLKAKARAIRPKPKRRS